MLETFLVLGRLERMTWEAAYALSGLYRIKTSLALTRARSRRAMRRWM